MIKLIMQLLVTALTLLAIARFVPGIYIANTYTAFVVAILWGIISLFLKPILSILTLPINLLTLGLFSLVVNALLFWILATFVAGFTVAGFVPAFIGSFLLSIVIWFVHRAL